MSVTENEVSISVSVTEEKVERGPTPKQRAALYEAAVWRGCDHSGHRIRRVRSNRFVPSRYRTGPTINPERRTAMSRQLPDVVVTRSFGAAVYLHAQGHPVLHVRSRDGSAFNAYITFPTAARADMERYYKTRDLLNAEIERYLAFPPNTNSEDHTHVTSTDAQQ